MRTSELVYGEEYRHRGLSGSCRVKYKGQTASKFWFVFVSDEEPKGSGECWMYDGQVENLISGKYESGIDNG